VADNGELAELYGISANRAYVIAMASPRARERGIYLYGTRASMIPTAPLELMLLAVIATILGGIGSSSARARRGVPVAAAEREHPGDSLAVAGLAHYFVLFVVILFFPDRLRVRPG
jgi:branched-subunit amino acid ABC-type transport system permease component